MVTRLPWMAHKLTSSKRLTKVGLGGFLEGSNGSRLEAQIGLEVLGNFTDKTLEGQLADQQLGALLVAADFAEGDGAGAVAMGLLDAARGGRRDLRAALVAICLRGALPPVDLRAVCLVRAISVVLGCLGKRRCAV